MRLTTVGQMSLPPGRVRSLALDVTDVDPERVPVSFDQARHVGVGDRPGSWMAVAARMPRPADDTALAEAWMAVCERHATMRTVFSHNDSGEVELCGVTLAARGWHEHDLAGRSTREVLRELFDATCRPFSEPSHRLAVVEPDATEADRRPVVVIASDHAHVDMWSLVVLLRDLLDPSDVPAASFTDHTRVLAQRESAPVEVHRRWTDILEAGGGVMPLFPLPLGDVSTPREQVVEVLDVLDTAGATRLTEAATATGIRTIVLAVSVLTRVTREIAGSPLRAVFPVHSRDEERWQDAVGWFITNAVIESDDPDPQACRAAVKEALGLGSWPLEPILAPWGGMPEAPGMFALSWLDTRRLPVSLDPGLEVQYVSARIRTDGVMIWFVVNDAGLHLRCRYPDTPEARANVGRWLDAVVEGLRALT